MCYLAPCQKPASQALCMAPAACPAALLRAVIAASNWLKSIGHAHSRPAYPQQATDIGQLALRDRASPLEALLRWLRLGRRLGCWPAQSSSGMRQGFYEQNSSWGLWLRRATGACKASAALRVGFFEHDTQRTWA